jgi:C-methyltransferase
VLAGLLEKRLAVDAPLRILDVACGTGLYGFTVAQQFTRASVTCVDLERVLARTKLNAEKMSLADRVSYIAGDMFTSDLGGPYDLIIASHVFHHFDDDRSLELMRRLGAVTRPGGTIAVHDFVINGSSPASHPEPHLFATIMLASTRSGDTYSTERFRRLLQASGYRATEEPVTPSITTQFLFAERNLSA